jgi:hypothetical protein
MSVFKYACGIWFYYLNTFLHLWGACGSVVGWCTLLHIGSSRVRFPMRSLDFSIDLSFQPHYGPGVDSAFDRNEYQEYSRGGKGRPARKADFNAICEPIVLKIWEPWPLTTLWASTSCNLTLTKWSVDNWGVTMVEGCWRTASIFRMEDVLRKQQMRCNTQRTCCSPHASS